MKGIKKIVSAACVLALVLGIFTSCGKKDNNTSGKSPAKESKNLIVWSHLTDAEVN
ncbi:MAG TPA: maltose ABC transporter substrate-binding protein, partial [Clostridiaceae bacterium]|nr:maltose ABC transporter substrate-binding protein [Clostridiaceae bacterium]